MSSDNDGFIALAIEETTEIKNKIGDSLLNNTMKDIFECHGDPSGNLLYVGGISYDGMYCIYIKKIIESESNHTSTIIKYNNINEYVDRLVTIDGELFNR
jgi:hypothetical protein